MSRIVRADPYLTREDTGADEGRTPAVQHYEKQNGSDGATSNTVFTLSKAYVTGSNTLVIYVNGQKAELLVTATDETEYEETSSLTVTFGASLLDTDVVEFMVYGTYFIQDTDNFVTKAEENNDNIIINGDFNVWQRGTSFAAAASTTFSTDRFEYLKAGAAVHTLSRSTDVPTEGESGHESSYSLKTEITTIDDTVAAGDVVLLDYQVEGYDFQPLVGNYGTLSFWVKGSVTGTHCVAFTSGSADMAYIAEYTISAADTWEKKTITVNFNYSAGTWNYTSSSGLYVRFCLMSGTTFQTTAGTWTAGNYVATSSQVNTCETMGNTFQLSQVKLELGQIATPFKVRPFAQELALCQRYYEKSCPQASFVGYTGASGMEFYHVSTTSDYRTFRFATAKRAAGTLYFWAYSSGTVSAIWNNTTSADDSSNISSAVSESSFYMIHTSALDANAYAFSWAVDAEL